MLKPPQPIMNGVHGKSIASMTGLPNGKAKVAPMDNPDIQIEVGVALNKVGVALNKHYQVLKSSWIKKEYSFR